MPWGNAGKSADERDTCFAGIRGIFVEIFRKHRIHPSACRNSGNGFGAYLIYADFYDNRADGCSVYGNLGFPQDYE